jgi:superfamily II DNA or RNA helicase
MLGLSATMNRKDGLTKVFQLFLGDIEYKVIREKTNNVIVNAIYYKTNDLEFNETILNHKGQSDYSKMLSKITTYLPRTLFIIEVLKNLLSDPLNHQIMILAQYKHVLNQIYSYVEEHNLDTVGYYIGGMKQTDLKSSETKKIILATYAMAEEALDIKTLTTLMMITPKTNVTQSVGRILRSNHERPFIVDIIDKHDVFHKQWYLRKKFYNQNNYTIMYSNNLNYPMMEKEKEKIKKCSLDLSKFNELN